MPIYPKDYFEDEERLGFHIESMMKKAWAVQMDVLLEIDRICKKHDIMYYAAAGTMLGAVRHKGYIPWDDDIDISMKRKDYMKFLSVARQELKEEYYLHSIFTDKDHNNLMSAVMKSKDSQYGFPYIAGVDILPLDFVPKDEDEGFMFTALFGLVYETARTNNELSPQELKNKLEEIKDLTGVSIEYDESTHQKLWLLADNIAKMYQEDEAKGVSYIPYMVCRDVNKYVDVSCYDSVVYMPFEKIEVPVPQGYDRILRCLFGDEYMTPQRLSSDHEYPFYAKQQC